MDLTRIAPTDRQHIQKYSPNGFVVSGVVFTGPILVFSQESLSWNAEASEFLKPEDLTPILERARTLDLCLLGCGNRMTPVALAVRQTLKEAGIGIEPMDTGAACRTFNVLLAEGRAVMAALFPPAAV
ncbi:MAG: hypothetical protein HN793_06410 [Rhodospirillaceae bacterium]|jgi:uncharacterized protein|nr:hypothetical protein [Rhodospirillaceae bacterium]MBT5566824.1 hypothetical protein [Rhodospirillaceae bacterium]MBT6089463.1 hypothetical protein [Rhodospirillaceae bacterium]MBT7450440.1 hypothetical protein [Rhodospirillaceae bacterium]